MRRFAVVLGVAALAAACSQEVTTPTLVDDFDPALAAVPLITNGEVDGEGHPFVGLMVALDENGGPLWRCSGTLISPTLFLTAGHCTHGAPRATIWFDADVDAGIPGNGYPWSGPVNGAAYSHPNYNPNAFVLYDLGVVVLDEPVYKDAYGELPDLGVLDAIPPSQRRGAITAVGYGLQKINPVFVEAARTRLRATLNIVDLNGTNGIPAGTSVLLSNNAATGGTCFGDSGGPEFLTGTNIVAAVTSYGLNGNCAGTGGGYRIDQSDDLDWLSTFLN